MTLPAPLAGCPWKKYFGGAYDQLLQSAFFTVLLLTGQATLASPRDDANYIAQRDLGPDALEFVRHFLKRMFAGVYTRPFAELGIEVIDAEPIIDLVPDEDIAPYIDRYTDTVLSQRIEYYLSVLTPEQLAFLAESLRKDKDVSPSELLSEKYRQELEAALEQARATAPTSGSADPNVLALEEWLIQLNATIKVLDDNAELIGKSIGVAITPLLILNAYSHEIAQLHRDLDNPVAIAALKKNGVLRFANPVQRQTLLRQLSAPEEESGVRFLRPPAKDSGEN